MNRIIVLLNIAAMVYASSVQAQALPLPIAPKGQSEILVKSSVASEYRNQGTSTKYAPDKSYDNDLNTEYHSVKGATSFPLTITYNFEGIHSINKLDYYPRTDAVDVDGHWKELQILVIYQNDSTEKVFDNVGNGFTQFNRAYSPLEKFHYTIDFGKIFKNVKGIKFEFASGQNDMVTAAEIDFWEPNESDFDPFTIFQDSLFSKLKTGVSLSDINAISDNDFFKNYAKELYAGTYDQEFRVNGYKAYPNPSKVGNQLKIYSQSQCSNVTGIYLEKGDEIFVVSDGEATLMQVDFWPHAVGNDTLFDSKINPLEDQQVLYPIAKGFNRIVAKQRGLFYVQYWSDSFLKEPELHLNFMYGRVNGYFDGRTMSRNQWKDYLDKAQYPYYDVIGKYVQLTFPHQAFVDLTDNGKDLIDLYDSLNYLARKIHGHVSITGCEIPNHSHVAGVYKKYKYAAPYATYYNVTDPKAIEKNFNSTLLKSDFFGTVHEWGHSMQIRQELNWGNLTETTCNISAYYAWVTQLGHSNSKELNPSGGFPTQYEAAWNTYMVNNTSFADNTGGKMAMFWQLYLYCTKVLGIDDFYPKLHNYARFEGSGYKEEDAMLNFTYLAAISASKNLNLFFDKWNFYRPGTFIAGDYYGNDTFEMTNEIIERYQNKVRNTGFQVVTDAVEYITDNNYDLFKNQTKITKGTYRIVNNELTPLNWDGVVVYESLENGTLKAIFLAPVSIPLADPGVEQSIYAVQYDGERILVFSNGLEDCKSCYCGPSLVKINQSALDDYKNNPNNNHLEVPPSLVNRDWVGTTTNATTKIIEDNFSLARLGDSSVYREYTTLEIPAEFKTKVCPDGSDTCNELDKIERWFLLTYQQKGLFLINAERVSRGLPPFEGIAKEVSGVAQLYAGLLASTDNGLSHTLPLEVNGIQTANPWERLNAYSSVSDHAEFYGFAENLAYLYHSKTASNIPLEYAIYQWMYNDGDSKWGHRNFNLSILNENSGKINQEGLLGFGVKQLIGNDGSVKQFTVMNAIDPIASFDFESALVFCDSSAKVSRILTAFESSLEPAYPNPFNDQIQVGSMMDVRVQIFNSMGDLMLNSKAENGSVSTSNLAPGIYLVVVECQGTQRAQKMIKTQ